MPPSWCPGVLQEDISCEAMDTGSESSGHDEVFRDSYGEGSTEHAGVEPASKLAADLATELPRFSGGAELGQKGTRLRAMVKHRRMASITSHRLRWQGSRSKVWGESNLKQHRLLC